MGSKPLEGGKEERKGGRKDEKEETEWSMQLELSFFLSRADPLLGELRGGQEL